MAAPRIGPAQAQSSAVIADAATIERSDSITRSASRAHQHALLALPVDAVGRFDVPFHQFHRRLGYDDDVLRVASIFDAIELLRRRACIHPHEPVRTELERAATEQHVTE